MPNNIQLTDIASTALLFHCSGGSPHQRLKKRVYRALQVLRWLYSSERTLSEILPARVAILADVTFRPYLATNRKNEVSTGPLESWHLTKTACASPALSAA